MAPQKKSWMDLLQNSFGGALKSGRLDKKQLPLEAKKLSKNLQDKVSAAANETLRQTNSMGQQLSQQWKDGKGTESAQKIYERFQTASKNASDRVNPWATFKRWRRNTILLAFSGLFVYGISSNIPGSIAQYALEKSKESKAKAQSEENNWWKFWK